MSDGCDTRFRLLSLWARKGFIPLLGYCLLSHLLTQALHVGQLSSCPVLPTVPRLRAQCLQSMGLWRVARY